MYSGSSGATFAIATTLATSSRSAFSLVWFEPPFACRLPSATWTET